MKQWTTLHHSRYDSGLGWWIGFFSDRSVPQLHQSHSSPWHNTIYNAIYPVTTIQPSVKICGKVSQSKLYVSLYPGSTVILGFKTPPRLKKQNSHKTPYSLSHLIIVFIIGGGVSDFYTLCRKHLQQISFCLIVTCTYTTSNGASLEYCLIMCPSVWHHSPLLSFFTTFTTFSM